MIPKKYSDFIIHGEERSFSFGSMSLTLLKFTEYGVGQLKEWLNSNKESKQTICPFFNICDICEKIFMHPFTTTIINGITQIFPRQCPCYEFGTEICERVAEELLMHSGQVVQKIIRWKSNIPEHNDPCPKCGTQLIDGYSMSGVRCPKDGCGYWFCY